MFLIVIGLFTGIRHQFRNPGSYILLFLGGIFLLDNISNFDASQFIWPAAMIGLGLYMISGRNKSRRLRDRFDWDKRQRDDSEINPDDPTEPLDPADHDFMNSSSIFGGVKKNIVSKNFRGGDIVNFMGGAQINLSQADFQGRVVLEVTQVFGGTKIIVPPHWQIHHEMTAIFGGVEDKRQMPSDSVNSDKVLVIKGISIFGGIDIRNY
jgi:predicted membrane protein